MAIEILNVSIATDSECILPEAKGVHHRIVELLGNRNIRDRHIDVIDAYDVDHVCVGALSPSLSARVSRSSMLRRFVGPLLCRGLKWVARSRRPIHG